MNPAAYLERQGWRGTGHSLDAGNRGLAKPLLITHKTDAAGLGTKQNNFSNQWWLDAWDSVPIQEPKDLPKSAPSAASFTLRKYPYLHSTFVKAKPLEGTFSEPSPSQAPNTSSKMPKRRRDQDGDGSSKVERKIKKGKAKESVSSNGVAETASKPPHSKEVFFFDTVGDRSHSAKLAREKESKEKRNQVRTEKRAERAKKKTPEEVPSSGQPSSPGRLPADQPRMTNGNDRSKNKPPGQSQPALAQSSSDPKQRQSSTAGFVDASLSLNEMVRRQNEETKKAATDGQKVKRRAPRTIRKEAREAKQAAINAEAADTGPVGRSASSLKTKDGRQPRKKEKKAPTKRKLLKIERKLKRQEKSRAGAMRSKAIEDEALRDVERMRARNAMPDISKPIEELFAEKQLEIAAHLEIEDVKDAARAAVDRLKAQGKMPLDKTEAEVLAEQQDIISSRSKGQTKLPDFSTILLPNMMAPKPQATTPGVPPPNPQKRTSLKVLRRALDATGLDSSRRNAYLAKIIEDKKTARAFKDARRTDRRVARKEAKARKKLRRQEDHKARLQADRENKIRRAENAANELSDSDESEPPANTPLTKEAKKQKKKAREARKLEANTQVVLREREEEKRQRGDDVAEPTKLEVKQARRHARELVRRAKKGRIAREEVPEGFQVKRSQRLKLAGNGGRIPAWTAQDIADNIRTAQEDAIRAAEQSNKAFSAKKAEKAVDAIASGEGYVPL